MQKIQRRLEGMIRGNTKIMSAVLIAAMTVTAMTPLMTAAKEEHGTAADAGAGWLDSVALLRLTLHSGARRRDA